MAPLSEAAPDDPRAQPSAPPPEELLRRAHLAGQRQWGDLGLSLAQFTEGCAAALVQRSAGAAEVRADAAAAFERRAVADLYLAIACARGCAAAWERLTSTFQPRLRALLLQRGLGAADDVVQDLFGDLATPPPGDRRPRIASYDGTGSLFAWLAAILWRQIADRFRAAKRRGPVTRDEDAAPVPAAGADPLGEAIAAETTSILRASVQRAWAALGQQERLVLLFRHRDGLPQTRIAAVLGVTESRISRVLARATARLRAALEEGLGADGRERPPWRTLHDLIAQSMQESVPADDRLEARPHIHEPT